MRRPTSALAAAFLGTALVANSVSAQQNVPSLLGDDPASARTSGALTPAAPASSVNEDSRPTSAARSPDAGQAPPLSAAVNPARTARTLIRNGWDFITYQEYDRALAFFKEAESRKAELTDADRLKLKQGIAKARQAMIARARGGKVGPTYALSDQKPASRPTTTQATSEPFSDGDAMASASRMKNINNRIPSALQAAMHEKDAVELPPLADERPRADDQISRASNDNAPPEAAPAEPTAPAQPAATADPLPELAPDASVPAPASDGPAPAASPDMPPLPALPPPHDLVAPEPSAMNPSEAPPELPQGAQTTPAPEALAQPQPAPAEMGSAGLPLPASVEPSTAGSSELQDPSRSSSPAPEVESLPPLPASDEAPAAEAPGTPPPTEPNADVSPSTAPEESVARPDSPTTVPDNLNTPRGVFGRDTLIPERRSTPSRSSLSPELQREVEEVARRQEENTARDRATQPPTGVPDEEPLPGLPSSSLTTKLEISRAPSSTEARPIRAIPVPEEFVPLPKREWNPNRKFWAAAATCHLPLYFQDATLERYGYSTEQRFGTVGRFLSYPVDDPRQSKQRNQILQPFASAGLFVFQIGMLPWNLIMDPPWEAEYDLGFYRPGDRVPTDTFYLPLTGVGPPLHGRRYGDPRPRPAAMPASRW